MVSILRLFTILFIILFIFSCKKSPTESSHVSVTFPDANFEILIRETLEKPTGDIFDTDLESLKELISLDLNIVNLTGIEYCINLVYIDFSQNQITDINPLVNNAGLDA